MCWRRGLSICITPPAESSSWGGSSRSPAPTPPSCLHHPLIVGHWRRCLGLHFSLPIPLCAMTLEEPTDDLSCPIGTFGTNNVIWLHDYGCFWSCYWPNFYIQNELKFKNRITCGFQLTRHLWGVPNPTLIKHICQMEIPFQSWQRTLHCIWWFCCSLPLPTTTTTGGLFCLLSRSLSNDGRIVFKSTSFTYMCGFPSQHI